MNMTISVTQQDITLGKKGCYSKCPVALAVTRSVNCFAGVTARTIDLMKPDEKRIEISTPVEALSFIRQFDSSQPVEPFTFKLNIP